MPGTNHEQHKDDDAAAGDDEHDELVREILEQGRGDRDEPGVRDQWHSDEHLKMQYDSRKPVSEDVQRLLERYRINCDGCSHDQAVRKVRAFVQELKTAQKQQYASSSSSSSSSSSWTVALLVIVLSCIYVYRKQCKNILDRFLQNTATSPASTDDFQGFSPSQRAELIKRQQREQASRAATQRLQSQEQSQERPTWLDNEQKEIWTAKQEKQFRQALKEFSGVPKKERYKLIAEKVQGKSRIECLTHDKMQELLSKRKQAQEQLGNKS